MSDQVAAATPDSAPQIRSSNRRFPLRYQVLLPMSATMVVTLAIISLLTAAIAARSATARVDADVARIAETLRSTNFPLTSAVLDQIAGLSGAQLLLADSAHRISASSARVRQAGWQPDRQDREQANRRGDRLELAGEVYFHRVVDIQRRSALNQPLILHVFYPESAWRQARREAIYPPLVIGGVGAAILAALSIVLSRRVTRPISRIAGLMTDLAAGNYVPAAVPQRNDELRDLTEAANGLAAQLDELHGAIRRGERLALLGQLSGGLAHQMRNSATGARLAMQLHRRSCSASDRESIDVALRQLELVDEQLVSFLALGKPEDPRREPCDLAAIVSDVGQLVAANFRHRGIELQIEQQTASQQVVADKGQLRQALINLTLNALDAADRGGRVRIVLERHNSGARLSVYDTGSGVRPEVAATLFEPFVTTKPEGVGLGLAVAARVAAAHGGTLGYDTRAGETCFTIELPLDGGGRTVSPLAVDLSPATAHSAAQAEPKEPLHA